VDPSSIGLLAGVAVAAAAVGALVVSLLRRSRPVGADVDLVRREVEAATRAALSDVTGEALQRLVTVTQQQLQTQQQAAEQQVRGAQDGLRAIVDPLQANLMQLGRQVADLEARRAGAYAELTERLTSTTAVLEGLRTTTNELNTALRRSDVRGHWGELQLVRVIELAGLKEHVSYRQQVQVAGEGEGRPDVTVNLADGQVLYIDAKAPMSAFFDAIAEADRERQAPHLMRHAADLLGHVRELERRGYVRDGVSLPFMVLFVPNEASLAAALEADPRLLEQAMARGVALTGPTSLVMMLTNVSAAWRQQAMAQNAELIVEQVADLHQRFVKFGEHLARVGRSIESSVRAFNDAVGSYERRLLPMARRVEALAALPGEVESIGEVAHLPAVGRLAAEDATAASSAGDGSGGGGR
jgi:DNA recombination protein RmuC